MACHSVVDEVICVLETFYSPNETFLRMEAIQDLVIENEQVNK